MYKDFGKFTIYKEFIDLGILFTLKETISDFFKCDVDFFPHPSTQIYKKFNINILENPRRGFYPIDDDNVIILARVQEQKKLTSSYGIIMSAKGISKNVKLLNIFEGALSWTLTEEFYSRFQNGILAFGDELIKHTITNYLCKGYFNYRYVRHLIEYFLKLRTTSFEGTYFSTGVLISKSIHDFQKNNKRSVYMYDLTQMIRLRNTNRIEKRIWYLADGKKSFFLATKKLDISRYIVVDNLVYNENYIDNHTLSFTLKGGDSLFKIENEKLLSINTSSGYEFLFFENQWKFRNYNQIIEFLKSVISNQEELINSLLFYILNCSKKQISSIIWFPENFEEIDNYIQVKTKNVFINGDINIRNKNFINHIFRCLSSDGATIIDRDGNIRYIGVIADLNKIKIEGMKGTGESAATALGLNGVAIKISQDGTIKIYNGKSKVIY